MSYASADSSYDSPRLTPAVQGLIAVNVGIAFLQVTGLWSGDDMQRLLGFQRGDLQGAWWKALTYMFVHGGFWHLLGNMYMLFLFGPRLEHAWTTRSFLRFYLVCGLAGWLAHVLFVQQDQVLLIGASAAVFGVMFAYARQWKDEELYLFGVVPVKVRWLVAAYILYDLVMGLASAYTNAQGNNPLETGTAHFAHLGGVVAAWLYLKTPTAQSLDRFRQRVNQVPDVPDEPPRAVPRQAPRPRERGTEADEVVAKSKALVSSRQPQPPRQPTPRPPAVPVAAGSELDALLDKISAEGIESLTSDERQRLEEAATRLKNKG
jgi:membrane associated rhomboid family serine protease